MTTREFFNEYLDEEYRDAKQMEEIADVEDFLIDRVGGVFNYYANVKRDPEIKLFFEPIDFDSSDSIEMYRTVLNSILDNCSGNIRIAENIVKATPREILSIVVEMSAGRVVDLGIGFNFSIDQEKSDLDGLELKESEIPVIDYIFSKKEFLSQYGASEESDLAILFDNFYEFLTSSEERMGNMIEKRLLADRSKMLREIIQERSKNNRAN